MEERIGKRVDERINRFRRAFIMVTTSIVGLTAIGHAVSLVVASGNIWEAFFTSLGVVLAFVAFALAHRGRVDAASKAYIYGNVVFIALPMLINQAAPVSSIYASIGLIIISAFLLRPIHALAFGGICSLTVLFANIGPMTSGVEFDSGSVILSVVFLASVAVVVFLFTREATDNTEMLRRGTKENEILNQEILEVASRLGAATGQIYAMTQEQTQAAMHQSSAVEETRQVLKSVAEASAEIVTAAQLTLDNAEVTVKNSMRVSENIRTLTNHTQDIFRILEAIREVADKSDLLALNAALEGTKAGEVGRGFSLVASQMQRLAESTAQSVRDIQELTHDIRQATTETQLSMEEATKLASATTEAAHKINLITQQQRSGVEQVSTAVNDIVELTTKVATSTEQTISSTKDLQEMSEHLTELVKSFRVESLSRA